jgi:CheY-like chemotaxis protein
MKILVVDDDVTVQLTCQRMLQHLGHSSVGVQNAVDAIKRLTEIPPEFDLVMLATGLPELSGMEFFNILREWNLALPVILISADHANPEFEALLEVFSHIQLLPMPFTLETLQTAIERSQS